jgi:hypothetical protein
MIGVFRALQASCFGSDILSYPFNANEDVTTYQGIAFTMELLGDMFVEVQTLELDIRVEDDTDLAIEVYAYDGDYASVLDNLDEWEILADTELVLNPDSSRGAIIPAHAFRPFTVGQGRIKSMYLKMKGPWLDNTLDPFLGDGDNVPNEIGHLNIYPGVGITQNFPLSVDASARPIFAGNFHLRVEEQCEEAPLTKVEFVFVTNMDVTEKVLSSIAESIDMTIDSIFRLDATMVGFRNDDELEQVGQSEASVVDLPYLEGCEWETCTGIESVVTWTHSDELRVDQLKYRLYMHTDMIIKEIRLMYSGRNIDYVGRLATSADVQFILKDVRRGVRMDQSLQDYFENQTLEFINSEADMDTIEALSIEIRKKSTVSDEDEQEVDDNGEISNNEGDSTEDGGGSRALQDLAPIELLTRVRGTRYSHITEEDFATHIQNLFYNPSKVRNYVDKMRFEINYPGPLSEFERHEFFEDLVMISGTIDFESIETNTTEAPTVNNDDEGLKKFINDTIEDVAGWKPIAWILIGASVFTIIFVVVAFLVVRCIKEEIEARKRREERQADKEFMRQEKRLEDIRRKHMGLDDGTQMYQQDFDAPDVSFNHESFVESYNMEGSAMFDPQTSVGFDGIPPGMGPAGAVPPPGSRRKFYGPALAQIPYDNDVEQPRPIGGRGRVPPNRNVPMDNYESGSFRY